MQFSGNQGIIIGVTQQLSELVLGDDLDIIQASIVFMIIQQYYYYYYYYGNNTVRNKNLVFVKKTSYIFI